MMLSPRLLQTFVAVAEELHFGRAAERLHMSQPPLSQQIRQLEEALGVALFWRTTRQVRLTPAGAVLLERARQLLADGHALTHAVQRAARGETGSLTVGFSSSAAYRVLPKAIAAFRRRYPDVGLVFKEMHSLALIEGLRANRIDVALLRPPAEALADPALSFSMVLQEPMLLAMPAVHPLAAYAEVPVALLEKVPFIDFGPYDGRYFHQLMLTIFAAGGVRPHIVHESVLPTILVLVEAGMGLTLVPASASDLRIGQVVYRPLAQADEAMMAVMYGAWRSEGESPAAEAFIGIAREAVIDAH